MVNVRVIKLGTNVGPEIIENKRKEYVEFGKDNQFPQYLLDISKKTALHTAILDKKIKMDNGEGVVPVEDDKKTQLFLDNINPYENIDSLNNKIMSDMEIFGAFYLQIIWAKDGKSIAEWYHMPYDRIRSGKLNDKNQVDTYFYSEKWEKYTKKQDITEFPAFNKVKDKKKIQIYKGGAYNPASMYYSMPSYIGGLVDIDTLAEISIFHNSAIRNNFAPGALIVFKDRGTDEEMDTVVKQIEEKYKGSTNAGEPMIFFIEEGQEEPTVQQLDVTNLDKQFQQLSDTADKNVTLAHSIPRIVAGLETPGSLGSSKEVMDASLMFMNQYIKPQQNIVLNTYNKLMEINKMKDVKILNANPSLLLYSEQFLGQVLTKTEIREVFGYETEAQDITEIKINDKDE